MKNVNRLLFLIIMLATFGCESIITSMVPKVKLPMNPQEFRDSSKQTSQILVENFVVDKPFSYTVKRWKDRVKPCLSATYRKTYTRRSGFADSKTDSVDTGYTPKLKVSAKKAVLSLQMGRSGDNVGSNAIEPEDGAYFLVADASPLKPRKTKIVIYRWKKPYNFAILSKSMVNWASGKSTACPDYAKVQEYQW